MAKIYKKIIERNKNQQKNQEYKVCSTDDFHDGKKRMYDQTSYKEYESDIINKIKNGEDYRSDDVTPVTIHVRDGVEYIKSANNTTNEDNLLNLPKY